VFSRIYKGCHRLDVLPVSCFFPPSEKVVSPSHRALPKTEGPRPEEEKRVQGAREPDGEPPASGIGHGAHPGTTLLLSCKRNAEQRRRSWRAWRRGGPPGSSSPGRGRQSMDSSCWMAASLHSTTAKLFPEAAAGRAAWEVRACRWCKGN
jgi:hypothetical protein